MQKIEYVPIDKLKTHPQNPRLIKDESFKKLCASIKANPDYFETRPILANAQGIIFAGNMRYLAAKEIGLKEVPVAIMNITPERQREIMMRDNISLGENDYDILSNTFGIQELADWGMSKEDLNRGFDIGNKNNSGEDPAVCSRCAELKEYVEGHQKRTGHECMAEKKE